jgi:peroxiredoxin
VLAEENRTALSAVGTEAPDFSLPSTSGSTVTLSSFRGEKNVLLAFFPLAFTSTCTAELCAFSDDYDQFASATTVVLPISCDAVPSLKAYKASEQMKVDLLGDFMRTVSRAYGTLIEEKNHPSRAYILIDRSGIVRWTWVEEKLGHRRENSELLAKLAELR